MNILKALSLLDHRNIKCNIFALNSNSALNIRMVTYVVTFAAVGVSVRDINITLPDKYGIDDLWGCVDMDYSTMLLSTGMDLGEIYLLHIAAAKARIILPNGAIHKNALAVIESGKGVGVIGA